MRFEWDEEKNLINQRKHGLSFSAAIRVFDDPYCLIEFDRIDEETGEQRWHAIGTPDQLPAIVLVVHVYRSFPHGKEIIRIISARKAGKNHIRRYQEQTA